MMGEFGRRCGQLWQWVRSGEAWRWVAVLGAGIFGWESAGFGNAPQLALVLKFVVLVVVSLVCGSWAMIAAVEIALALLWWLVARRRRATLPARLVVEANRLIGHVEALGPLLVLSMVAPGPAWLRFGAAAWVVAWGPRALSWLTAQWHWQTRHFYPTDQWVRSARRLPMAGVTLIGGAGLVALAPEQWRAMAPVAFAVLAATALRMAVTFRRDNRQSGLTGKQWNNLSDMGLTVAVLAAVAGSAWLLTRMPDFADTRGRISQTSCGKAPEGEPIIATWLLADSQFHELRGHRPVANMPMVDAVVPVAVRPVVLDLLSGVTLDHFAKLYRRYADRHPDTALTYAYLGDLADIGCEGEMLRYPSYWQRFALGPRRGGPGGLAGIASGNHDNTYVGNFAWHPEWNAACDIPGQPTQSGIVDKDAANDHIGKMASEFGVADLWMPKEPPCSLAGLAEGKDALPMVSTLGHLPADASSAARPVVGVFLDTGESAFWQFGAAGSMGNVSCAQVEAVEARVPASALIVLMLHHPTSQLGLFSRMRLERMIGRWRAGAQGDRLLVVVSGHTHRSAWWPKNTLGDQVFREFTVGSTTDPSQEAAVLELRGTASKPEISLATVPAVQRPDMDCTALGDLDAATCEKAVAPLLASACLKTDEFDYSDVVDSPDRMTRKQEAVADELRACLGIVTNRPMDPEVYTLASRNDPGAMTQAMVCLSWAASLVQGRKLQGWRYADALRCLGERGATLGGLSVHWKHGEPPADP